MATIKSMIEQATADLQKSSLVSLGESIIRTNRMLDDWAKSPLPPRSRHGVIMKIHRPQRVAKRRSK